MDRRLGQLLALAMVLNGWAHAQTDAAHGGPDPQLCQMLQRQLEQMASDLEQVRVAGAAGLDALARRWAAENEGLTEAEARWYAQDLLERGEAVLEDTAHGYAQACAGPPADPPPPPDPRPNAGPPPPPDPPPPSDEDPPVQDVPPPAAPDAPPPGGCCAVDIDIGVPRAQNVAQPLVAEGFDASRGVWVLHNDDIDATGAALLARLRNHTRLTSVGATVDARFGGRVPGRIDAEDDLARIVLRNPAPVAPVYLNAYAFSQANARGAITDRDGFVGPITDNRRLRVFRNANRTGEVRLPYTLRAREETLYVEGLLSGRFRFLLFHDPRAAPNPRTVRARHPGRKHGRTVAGPLDVTPAEITCRSNVRLTVAEVDIDQPGRREHVFDALWGGRPPFRARVWPGGGRYVWEMHGARGRWLDVEHDGHPVTPRGRAAGDARGRAEVHGVWASRPTRINAAVRGSGLYDARVGLAYTIEGTTLRRAEPLTLITPHALRVTTGDFRPARINRRGRDGFRFTVVYGLEDQHGRRIRGTQTWFDEVYGARIRMYEALGPVAGVSVETGDNIFMTRIPEGRREIHTAQRSRRVGLDDAGRFRDSFFFRVGKGDRDWWQVEMRAHRMNAGDPIFATRQDIVAVVENGDAPLDVRVARNNLLEFIGPHGRHRRPWKGSVGYRMTFGGAGGRTLATGAPVRVAPTYQP